MKTVLMDSETPLSRQLSQVQAREHATAKKFVSKAISSLNCSLMPDQVGKQGFLDFFKKISDQKEAKEKVSSLELNELIAVLTQEPIDSKLDVKIDLAKLDT